jgi:hypothetical protein
MRFTKPSRDGRGYAYCDRSGLLTEAEERVDDFRGGTVRPESADLTPGFGTRHPSDVYQPSFDADPEPIDNPRPEPGVMPSWTLSDAERERKLRDPKGTG